MAPATKQSEWTVRQRDKGGEKGEWMCDVKYEREINWIERGDRMHRNVMQVAASSGLFSYQKADLHLVISLYMNLLTL